MSSVRRAFRWLFGRTATRARARASRIGFPRYKLALCPVARPGRGRILSGESLEGRQLLTLAFAGPELRLNMVAGQEQQNFRESAQSIALAPNGSGVATWSSFGQDGDGWSVIARRIAPGGFPIGRDLVVNTTTLGDQQFSSVAVAANGSFVVTWRAIDSVGAFARRYNAFGVPQGLEFRVNSFDTYPSIGMDADGNFIIVSAGSDEAGNGVFGQRFAADGTPVGELLRISTGESDRDSYPQVAMDADGDFAVTWSAPDNANSSGIFARAFNALAEPTGAEFQVSQSMEGTQWFSTIDMDADGDFVISWTGQTAAGGRFGILARRYAAGGLDVSGEEKVSETSADDAQYSRIALDDAGNYVITWTAKDLFQDGIFARRFTFDGQPQDPFFTVFQVNTLFIEGVEQISGIGADADGDFIVTWSALEQDNLSWNVRIQGFESNNPPIAVDDVAETNEVTSIFIDILANDTDADGFIIPSTVAIVLEPTHGTVAIDPTTGGLFYTPAIGYVGPVTIGYTVSDEQLAVSNVGFVSITIVPLAFRPWQNPNNIYDVDGDGAVAPIDALILINDLDQFGGGRPLQIPPAGEQLPPPFYDVSGDDLISPLDALLVINQLNLPAPPPVPIPLAALADAAFAADGLAEVDLADAGLFGRVVAEDAELLARGARRIARR